MSDDSAAAESATRAASGRRVSALLDAEQLSRISLHSDAHTSAESAAADERLANQSAAGEALDKEQAERVAALKAEDDAQKQARWESANKAKEAVEREQVSLIAAKERAERESKAERERNQNDAAAALDAEQLRRVFEMEQADEAAKVERLANQKAAGEALDAEQKERSASSSSSGPARRKSSVSERGVLAELVAHVPVDASEGVINQPSVARGIDEPPPVPAASAISLKASGNVGDLMKQDAGDESLRKYKESLLGAAARGDLGDVKDKRRVVVAEFRVVFEDSAKYKDIVHTLDTPEGVAKMTAEGISMVEGCGFKFQLKFRVNGEIVTGLKFKNKVSKSLFSNTEELVIGSFAPGSQTYNFDFPRYGFNTAPSGMLFRGEYRANDAFLDSDGNTHLQYDYKVKITK